MLFRSVFQASEIPERSVAATQKEYRSEAALAADSRSERENFYAKRRARALADAEKVRKTIEQDREYARAETAIRKGEIALAKAEFYEPQNVPSIRAALEQARAERSAALQRLHLSESDLQPKFFCAKCSDTGYLPDGKLCDCYRKA